MVGQQQKPQWRPGGTKAIKGGRTGGFATPTASSNSKRRDNDRGVRCQQYSKPWRQNNDTISEVGSVACSVMTPQIQDQPRLTSEQVEEGFQVAVKKENKEDSTAESNPKENRMNDQDLEGIDEEAALMMNQDIKGGSTTIWKLNKQQIQILDNLGNEFIKLSKQGVIQLNSDTFKNCVKDPSAVAIAALTQVYKKKNKFSWLQNFLNGILSLFLIFILCGLVVMLLVFQSLVIAKLYVD